MEISPSGACNHRCVFCALDFMKYRPLFLDSHILIDRLFEMADFGLRSIMFAGEGEPLIHRDILHIAGKAREAGLDIAFTTNGVLLNEKTSSGLLPVTEWIKVSCNAGSAETYSALHRCPSTDFNRLFTNLETAVKIKTSSHLSCTLGLQMILLPENREEVIDLALRCRDIGLDYLVVKPYSQHPQSTTRTHANLRYSGFDLPEEKLKELETDAFSIIHRRDSMDTWDRGAHRYDRCLALPFWSYLAASGDIYGCSMFLNDDRFCYGNIHHQSFKDIWLGEKRRASLDWVANHLDVHSCRINCRMDKINQYLWSLTHPPAHVNFI